MEDNDDIREAVRGALFRCRRYKRHSLAMFDRALRTEARKRARVAETVKVLMLTNIHRQSLAPFEILDILGLELQSPGWHGLDQQVLEIEPVWEKVDLLLPVDRPRWESGILEFSPIVCVLDARTVREAVQTAERAFNVFRGLLNLDTMWGRAHYQFGDRSRPLGKILPSPIFAVFSPTGSFREPLYHTIGLNSMAEWRSEHVTRGQIRKALGLATHLSPQGGEDDLRSMLTDVILKYGQAADTAEWREAFLSLWQALELVALQGRGSVSVRKVVPRVTKLLGEDQLLADVLRCARRTRNELVHLGRFSEAGLHQVNLLKAVVDRAIAALLEAPDSLGDTRDLAEYYRYYSVNDTDLRRAHRAIEVIAGQRGASLTSDVD